MSKKPIMVAADVLDATIVKVLTEGDHLVTSGQLAGLVCAELVAAGQPKSPTVTIRRHALALARTGKINLVRELDQSSRFARFRGLSPRAKPEAFSDSFTTADATFSVEVKMPRGEVTEDIEVMIDCRGMIRGDEDLIDVLIEMLENAKQNLMDRRV